MKHAMIDLETLGTASGSVILSIGGCIFDEQGVVSKDGMVHVFPDAAQQMTLGLTVDPSTIMWWLGQDKNAQEAIRGNVLAELGSNNLTRILPLVNQWLEKAGAEAIWSNGADFDIPLLTNLYRVAGVKPGWKYNAGRCCRTIMAATGRKMGDFGTKNALAHDALSDAIYQAGEVAAAMRWLARTREDARQHNAVMHAGAESQ